MKNFKMIVSYDGTRYKGWQVQKKEENTIQGKLQNILSLLMEEPVEVIGSGRTDAGVHARGQVANFHLEEKRAERMLGEKQAAPATAEKSREKSRSGSPDRTGKTSLAEELYEYLNSYLPEDIAVLSVEEVCDRFHARYNALRKTYRYRIHTGAAANVFERKYVYTYRDYPLDTGLMRQAADLLCGTHDFASFCGTRHMKKSTVRTIESIEILAGEEEITLVYTGDGFLQNMVRILTGTLIEVGSGRRDPLSMPRILSAKDREAAGYTAPPQGLILDHVEYE